MFYQDSVGFKFNLWWFLKMFCILPNELYRFLHQIHSYKISVTKENAFPICCFELDHAPRSIETCWLAGHHDEAQKNILESISFCRYSSYMKEIDVRTYITH